LKLNDWKLESTQVFKLDWFDGGHFFLQQSEEWFLLAVKKRLMESQVGISHGVPATA
jgi:surfactin synthase thioesterase subunit